MVSLSFKEVWLFLIILILDPLIASNADVNNDSLEINEATSLRTPATLKPSETATHPKSIKILKLKKIKKFEKDYETKQIDTHSVSPQPEGITKHTTNQLKSQKHAKLKLLKLELKESTMFPPVSSTKHYIIKSEPLFIHKFGTLHSLISKKQWIAIQEILQQKMPLRAKHFEVTNILKTNVKFNQSQIQTFWNDFFDFHVLRKVVMLHNKILHAYNQNPIQNDGIYDVELSVFAKVKLLNAQIQRYLPPKEFEAYLKTQQKLFQVSFNEKEALKL